MRIDIHRTGFPAGNDSDLSPLAVTRSAWHTPAERRTTARGRSPGSRVIAFARLPKDPASVTYWTVAHRLQLRGQPRFHIRVPFDPFREPRVELNANGLGQIRSIGVAGKGGNVTLRTRFWPVSFLFAEVQPTRRWNNSPHWADAAKPAEKRNSYKNIAGKTA